MNKKAILKLVCISILITLSILFIILMIDNLYFTNKYFNLFSKNFYEYINYQFGYFSLLYIISMFAVALFLMVNIRTINKIICITGYLLFLFTIPAIFDLINLDNVYSGNIGFLINNNILIFPLFLKYLFLFIMFFISFSMMLFPIKRNISILLFNLYSFLSGVKVNNSKKEKKKVPFISKVVFENSNNRIEYPVFANDCKIKKFRFEKESNTSVYYKEVNTFSGSEKTNNSENKVKVNESTQTIDKEDYFQRIKQNWPEHWKGDKINNDNNNLLIEKIDTQTLFFEELEDSDEIIDFNQSLKCDAKSVDCHLSNTIPLIESNGINNNNLTNKVSLLNKIANITTNMEDIEDAIEIDNYLENGHENNLNSSIIDDDFILPDSEILSKPNESFSSKFSGEEKESAMILEQTLMEFGIKAEVCEIIHGPVVTLFKLVPSSGVKLSRIEGLSTNLALRLAAQSIRIIAPIPGEKVVGIEIPNKDRELVNFKEVVNSKEFIESKFNIPIGLGKDIYGNIIVVDLYKMPHILIAGATGAGKSVCVNSFISSILFSKTPEDLRLLLIDPKIVELKPYNNIPHLLTPVITESKDAMIGLKYLLYEMERRYSLLDEMGVRDIVEYQKMQKTKKTHLEYLPFIVCFVDEFADLMTTSGKEAEILFARLAAKARAVGILLVLATQRPSADVITGLIKSNVPARIAFQVISLQDSRIILDQKGAEKLLGQGDMLYLSSTQPFPIRIQGAFLSKEEVDSICEHWKSVSAPQYINISDFVGVDEDEGNEDFSFDGENKDPLFEQAVEIVYQTRKASASYLQRRLNIGYNRAARMVEQMEDMGIVGPQRGAKAREVIGVD